MLDTAKKIVPRKIRKQPNVQAIYRYTKRSYNRMKAIKKSRYDNIYHCCTQKTGSQWFRNVFEDEIFFKYTGLEAIAYFKLGLRYANLSNRFPKHTLLVHLYIDYPTFDAILKPENYKAFFILRDPRDAVVSWYYSAKFSHILTDPIPQMRHDLLQLGFKDGMKYVIDRLEEFGSFAAQRSWVQAKHSKNIAILRYEDFADDNKKFLKRLIQFLDIEIPEAEIDVLYKKYAFKNMANGRKHGEEDKFSHYRKGVAGDWQNYFDKEIMAHFRSVTNDTLEVLGYQE